MYRRVSPLIKGQPIVAGVRCLLSVSVYGTPASIKEITRFEAYHFGRTGVMEVKRGKRAPVDQRELR